MEGVGNGHGIDGIEQEVVNTLILARTGLIFTVARRGLGQDMEVISHWLTSFSGNGGRGGSLLGCTLAIAVGFSMGVSTGV